MMPDDPSGIGDPDNGFELVMPFVIVKSVGGPYDDDAFAAGWRLGVIESALRIAASLPGIEPTPIGAPADHGPQIDLIAMRYGWVMTTHLHEDVGAIYTFERATSA
jgi:hypothetical protein